MEKQVVDYHGDPPLNDNDTSDNSIESTDCVAERNSTNNCDTTQSEHPPIDIETMGHRQSSFDFSAKHEGN